MKKIVLVGAGSVGFTLHLVRDFLTYPALSDSCIALVDINEERLGEIRRAVEAIIEAAGCGATTIATTSRAEAFEGADGIVCTILHGGLSVWRRDVEIPKNYGVDINIGDTRGPAGIFRALRTIPVMLDICRDVERCCPDAVFLNYTNPMAMICRAVQTVTRIRMAGLCHSVQHTASMLAGWIGAPKAEIACTCAGINHQAWFLDFQWNGRDAYPLLREAVKRPEVYDEERVRNEMFTHLGYYVTETSGHNSEYNAWFRKRPDLLERYCLQGGGMNPGLHARLVQDYAARQGTWKQEVHDALAAGSAQPGRSEEYASGILDAMLGDRTVFRFHGNVRNAGLIDNLPQGCCVEVPMIASRNGLEAIRVGPLPPQLALLNDINARCEELAVEGALTGDAEKVYHAVYYDPLTSAVLGLSEIRDMVREMFAANEAWLPQFKRP